MTVGRVRRATSRRSAGLPTRWCRRRRRRCWRTSSCARSSAGRRPSRAGRRRIASTCRCFEISTTKQPARATTIASTRRRLTKKPLELAKIAQAINRGAGFIYHCAEGQVGSLVAREFVDVANAGCLAQTFIGVHCNAIAAADWQRWDKRKAGAIAWSPFSNLWLYGTTTGHHVSPGAGRVDLPRV